MPRRKKKDPVAVAASTSVDCSANIVVVPVYMQNAPDQLLEDAVRWLESGNLDERGRENIVQASGDAAAKMAMFNHALGVRRAGRIARTQQWLGIIEDRLFSPETLAAVNAMTPDIAAKWWLRMGEFFQRLQKDDTDFVLDLAKNSLGSVRQAVESVPSGSTTDIKDIPSHRRERLRKFLSSILERADKETT